MLLRIKNKKDNDSRKQTINFDEKIISDPKALREHILRDFYISYYIGRPTISFYSFGQRNDQGNWINPLSIPMLEFIADILTTRSDDNEKIQKVDLYLDLSIMQINNEAMSVLCAALKKSLCKNIILDFKYSIMDDQAYITLAKYIERGDYGNINLDLRLETAVIDFSTEVMDLSPIRSHFISAFSQKKNPPLYFTTSSAFVFSIFKNFTVLLTCSYLRTLKISKFDQIEKLQISDESFLEYLESNTSLTDVAVHRDYFGRSWYGFWDWDQEFDFFSKVQEIIDRNKMLQAEQNEFDGNAFVLLHDIDHLPKELLKLIIQYVGELSTAPTVIHKMLDRAVEVLKPDITPSGLTKACLILSSYLNEIDAPQIALHKELLILLRDHIRLFCSYVQKNYDNLDDSPKRTECEYVLIKMITLASPKHEVIREIVLHLKEGPSLKKENIKRIEENFEIKNSEPLQSDQYPYLEVLPKKNVSLKKEPHSNDLSSHCNPFQTILFNKNLKTIRFHGIDQSTLEDIIIPALIASDITECLIPNDREFFKFKQEIEIILDYNKREISESDRALYKQKRAIQAFKEVILRNSYAVFDTKKGFVIFSFITARNPEYLEAIFKDKEFRNIFIKNAISYFKQMIKISFRLYQRTKDIYFSGYYSDTRSSGWENHVLSQIKSIFVAAKITIKERDKLFNELFDLLSRDLYSIFKAEDKNSTTNKRVTQFILSLPVIPEEPFNHHSTEETAHFPDEKKHFDSPISIEDSSDAFKEKASAIDAILGQNEIAAELKACISNKNKYQDLLVKHLNNSNSLFTRTLSIDQIFQLQIVVQSHQTIPISQLKKAIEIYQWDKGKGRKYLSYIIPFIKNTTITVSHFDKLLHFAGKNQTIDISLIELCLKARDQRDSVGREGVIRNSFRFYKSGELPKEIQNNLNKTEKDTKTNLSQTELLINSLRPKP